MKPEPIKNEPVKIGTFHTVALPATVDGLISDVHITIYNGTDGVIPTDIWVAGHETFFGSIEIANWFWENLVSEQTKTELINEINKEDV